MLTHHIITISLMAMSYRMNYTRIGNAVLVLMDPADIMLAIAKMLKYLGFHTLCDAQFGVFVLVWFVTRNLLYPRLLWSVIHDPQKYIRYKWRPSKDLFFTVNVQRVYIVFLGALQLLLIMWFVMIIKVIVNVLRGGPAEDSRSDDEDEWVASPFWNWTASRQKN